MALPELDTFVDGAAVRRAGDVTFPMVRDSGAELLTVAEGAVCTEMLELYQIDGIIAVPAGSDQRHLAAAAAEGVPVVLASRPPEGFDADCVLVDDFGGARAATARLLARGHHRVGFLGSPPAVYTGTERLRGYHAALADAGLPTRAGLVRQVGRGVVAVERGAVVDQPDAPVPDQQVRVARRAVDVEHERVEPHDLGRKRRIEPLRRALVERQRTGQEVQPGGQPAAGLQRDQDLAVRSAAVKNGSPCRWS